MIVNIRLNLPKEHNKITLRYNTFEKVPFDKYLIASLLNVTRNRFKAENLINELAGNGSLNSHFNNLYEEVKELSDQEIEDVLKNSLYPIQKIDELRYIYIPMLDISIYNKRVINGNLLNDDYFPRSLVEEGGTYISHSYSEPEVVAKADNYSANLTDDTIEIKVSDKFHAISQSDFQSIVIQEEIDLGNYQGEIFDKMIGNGWIQLTKSTINNVLDSRFFYYKDGNHVGIYNDNAKMTSIANRWGIYWVKEQIYKYEAPSSKEICEMSAKVLMESGRINEIKTKSLLSILKNINRESQQNIINYILSIRGDKELAINGFILIEKGFVKGWDEFSIKRLYEFYETDKQLLSIYKINSNLNYPIDNLLAIDKLDGTILTEEHKNQVTQYNNDRDQIIENINKKIGVIVSSGIRDNIGKMPLDDNSKKLRRFITDHIAHPKNNKNKTLQQLQEYEKIFDENFEIFKIVLNRWNEYKQEHDS